MSNSICLLYALILLCGCTPKSNKSTSSQDKVTFIFHDPVEQARFDMTASSPEYFSFVNSAGVLQDYRPQEPLDTLTITTNGSSHVEVVHMYRVSELAGFLVGAGDTVSVQYDKQGYPMLKSHTSEKLTRGYGYRSRFRNAEKYNGLDPYAIYTSSFYRRLDQAKRNGTPIPKGFTSRYVNFDLLKEEVLLTRSLQKRYLDSLLQEGMVDRIYGSYNDYQAKRERIMMEYSWLQFSKSRETYQYLDSLFVSLFSDSLTSLASYHFAIKSYQGLKAKSSGIDLIRDSNGSYYDYRQLFDLLKKGAGIPQKTGELLLYYTLESIVENFSGESIERYLESFLTETGDTAKYRYIIQKYNLDFTKSNDLVLLGLDGNSVDLNTLLKKHSGKVVYVDFWASWCAPCREAMPHAWKLREEFKGQDVVFIYLALNDKDTPWRDAIRKLNMESNSKNYFVVNSKTAKLIEQLNVRSIPRYMLFDKSGTLANAKAPGPQGAAIRNELRELLTK